MTKEEILQAIEGMTVLELSELVKDMEEKFGVSAAGNGVQTVARRTQVAGFALLYHDIAVGFGEMRVYRRPAAGGRNQCDTAAEYGVFVVAVGSVWRG